MQRIVECLDAGTMSLEEGYRKTMAALTRQKDNTKVQKERRSLAPEELADSKGERVYNRIRKTLLDSQGRRLSEFAERNVQEC